MTVIRPNSVSGINSITAQADEIKVFKSNGTQGGLIIGGANLNATTGISTILALNVTGNVSIAGTLTYQDVTNVDSLGIGTFRTGINVSGGQLDVGSNIKIGNAGVITATSFSGSGANLTGVLKNVVEDTSPQLGGDLDTNGHHILLDDNHSLQMGNSNDFQIQHNTNENFIDSNSGHIYIRANVNDDEGDNVYIQPKAGENSAVFTHDGAVELYFDNSKKFETSSSGCTVTGTLATTSGINAGNNISMNDNTKLKAGTGDDLQIYHDGSDSLIKDTGTGFLKISGNQIQIKADDADEKLAVFDAHGAVELYHNNTKRLETFDNNPFVGVAVTNDLLLNSSGDSAVRWAVGGTASSNFKWSLFYSNSSGSLNLFDNVNSRTITSFKTDGSLEARDITPQTNNSYDLGTTSKRWRNIYTNDLNLSNEGSTNSVDNTWGNYTIQEGESDLFLINNRNGKKYKFNLTEVV